MGLLTIEEPDLELSKEPLSKDLPKIALGIDLGTTHSLVGAYIQDHVVLFKNTDNQVLLPSVVLYTEKNKPILVGQEALASNDKKNAIFSVKRFMGKAISDIQVDKDQKDQKDSLVTLNTPQGIKTPIQISAEILKKLMRIAIANLDQEYDKYDIAGAVITVPAYFDDGQRQATKAAAEVAGIKVLRLLNEPTAAALAYGYDSEKDGTYLIYDLGGGTFDVSILHFHQGIFEVLATAGDTALGGDDMDTCIMEYFQKTYPTKENPIDRDQARKIKEALTLNIDININIDKNIDKNKVKFSREQLNKIIKPLMDKTIKITQQCIQDAKIALKDIHKIILVGGATRIPAIQEALSAAFHLPLSQELDPDKVVAMGASLQAAKLMGQTNSVLLDVVPLSLGIELMGGVTEKIIPRNSKLPISLTQVYTTYQDNQTGFTIQVVQGERELVKDNRLLAKFELKGLPPLPQGKLRIAMTFNVDVDGLLTVTAREMITNQSHEVEVKPTYGLTQIDIDAAILKAAECAKTDVSERQLREAKREASKLMTYANGLLASIDNLDNLNNNDAEVRQALQELNEAIEKNALKSVLLKTKALENVLMPLSLSSFSEGVSL